MAAAECWIDCAAGIPDEARPGFGGRFRELCADFEVTEIDKSGARVEEGPSAAPDEPAWVQEYKAAVSSAKKRRRLDTEALRSAAADGRDGDGGPVGDADRRTEVLGDLTETLARFTPRSDAVAGEIAKLAELVQSGEKDPVAVSIAAIPDRDARLELMRAIRAAHPCLTTGPAAEPDADGVRLTCVKPCGHFAALCAAVGAEGAARAAAVGEGGSTRLKYVTSEKGTKKAFHEALRKGFGLEATVVEGLVEVRRSAAGHKRKRRGEAAAGAVPHTHFVLKKRGYAWFAARHILSRHLRVPEEHVQCAGIKDKKGVTLQWCSARGAHGDALSKFNVGADVGGAADDLTGQLQAQDEEPPSMSVSRIAYATKAVATGDLSGNRFRIRVREALASAPEAAVRSSVAAIADRGFPNYFGPQRFGLAVKEGITLPGVLLALGDWRGTARSVLAPTSGDRGPALEAKQLLQDGGEDWGGPKVWEDALGKLPLGCAAERSLLQGMLTHPQHPEKWLWKVPHSVRELWVHAAQSWVWNRALRDRLRVHGSAVLKGDLVQPAAAAAPVPCSDPGECSVWDVVLPKPGGGAVFPQGPAGDFYTAVLSELGLPRDTWAGAKSMGIHLSKDYRRAVVRCSDAEVAFDGSDAVVAFSLPPSSYATVCLGTMMKKFLA